MMTNNEDAHRFELSENGHTAYADYRLDGARLYIDYVEAPPPLRGTGAAGRLMADIMVWARERGLEVVPVCGYAAAWIRRHPQA